MKKQALVIFGATGNLMFKKLIPALYHLLLIDNKRDIKIFAVGRTNYTTEEYIEAAKLQLTSKVDWDVITPHLQYVRMGLDSLEGYQHLKACLDREGYEDMMFYLAVPPNLFPVIAKGVCNSKLVSKGDNSKRIVFEKPFGEDLVSAKQINRNLWEYFDESQIYRIDHYLGKDMIQNILVVRFGNKIFENTWNHNMIRSVVIVAKETEGVMSRGGYYDTIGALKDMIQSHLLQMASMVAMSKPLTFTSEDIKDQKVNVFNAMKIDPSSIVKGQYLGYKDTEKISEESITETFVYCKATIDNDKWKDVPFYFITGKKLDEKRSEIIINFKDDDSLRSLNKNALLRQNKLIIKVSPDDGVEFRFNVKTPGLENSITTAALDYCHSCLSFQNTPEAYEKLLLDLMDQNRTLFTRWDEIESTWSIVNDAIIKKESPYIYKDYKDLTSYIKNTQGVDINDL